MSVRCKFAVTARTERQSECWDIELSAVGNGPNDDAKFFKYTPCGTIKFSTINGDAALQFIPGKKFYLDFTPDEN